MKIKFNTTQHNYFLVYFIDIMTLNIDDEYIKLTHIINNDEFYCRSVASRSIICENQQINFLWCVLKLTMKYPQVELYLKNLLNYFTTIQLEWISGCSILHIMTHYPHEISLNSFEIIINYGVNVNVINVIGSTPAHMLSRNVCNSHVNSILNLLIKYGANLNVINSRSETILDMLMKYKWKLDKETKIYIMTLVDFGATSNSSERNVIYGFVEHCKFSMIKPAIKNENKI